MTKQIVKAPSKMIGWWIFIIIAFIILPFILCSCMSQDTGFKIAQTLTPEGKVVTQTIVYNSSIPELMYKTNVIGGDVMMFRGSLQPNPSSGSPLPVPGVDIGWGKYIAFFSWIVPGMDYTYTDSSKSMWSDKMASFTQIKLKCYYPPNYNSQVSTPPVGTFTVTPHNVLDLGFAKIALPEEFFKPADAVFTPFGAPAQMPLISTMGNMQLHAPITTK